MMQRYISNLLISHCWTYTKPPTVMPTKRLLYDRRFKRNCTIKHDIQKMRSWNRTSKHDVIDQDIQGMTSWNTTFKTWGHETGHAWNYVIKPWKSMKWRHWTGYIWHDVTEHIEHATWWNRTCDRTRYELEHKTEMWFGNRPTWPSCVKCRHKCLLVYRAFITETKLPL